MSKARQRPRSVLAVWIVLAGWLGGCVEAAPGSGDGGTGRDGRGSCAQRDEATCGGACVQLLGSWLDADGALHHDEFVACAQGDVCSDGSNCGVECTGAETCAADEAGTVYWFRGGGGCVPSAWVSDEGSAFPAEFESECREIRCAIVPQACADDVDAGPRCDPDEVEGYYCCNLDVVSEPECTDGTWQCTSGSLTNDDPCEKLGPTFDAGA